MRQYRGKRIDNGEWVYGYLIGNDVIVGEIVEFNDEYFNTEFWYKVDPKTVGQYTGLPNIEKTEMYEDDIVDWSGIKYRIRIGEFGVRDFETEEITDMVYGVYGSPIGETIAPFCYDLQINSMWIEKYKIKVIGSVHDNPELLNGEDEHARD